MAEDIASSIAEAKATLRAQADRTAAPVRKKYLKSPFEVLGCRVPVVNAAAREVVQSHRKPDPEALVAALDALWRSPVHDDHLFAIVLAGHYHHLLDAGHVAGTFRAWLAESQTWDHVDGICLRAVGPIAIRIPKVWPEIGRSAKDEHMWLRRASVLAHIPAIRNGVLKLEQFRRSCDLLIEEREFFIRKAIGWALRELSTRDLVLAEQLVRDLGPRASGLTLREATRRMPPARRKHVLRAIGRPAPVEGK